MRDSTQVAATIRSRYGDFETGFLARFTSGNYLGASLCDACRADTPTMLQVDNAYGSGSALTWLVARLTEVAAFTGIRDNMTDLQTLKCAQKIRQLGYHVTVAEMMAFFDALENGQYQTFIGYSRPNPQIIMQSFATFMSNLFVERANAEGEKDAARDAEERELAKRNRTRCPEELKKRINKLYLEKRYQLPERDRKRGRELLDCDKKNKK